MLQSKLQFKDSTGFDWIKSNYSGYSATTYIVLVIPIEPEIEAERNACFGCSKEELLNQLLG